LNNFSFEIKLLLADYLQRNLPIDELEFVKDRNRLLNLLPRGSVCAELGVWKAAYSETILKRVRPKKLHLIDAWDIDLQVFPYDQRKRDKQPFYDAI